MVPAGVLECHLNIREPPSTCMGPSGSKLSTRLNMGEGRIYEHVVGAMYGERGERARGRKGACEGHLEGECVLSGKGA